MAEYDPKRRRPGPPADDEGPAPVDALLEAVEHPHAPQRPAEPTAAVADTTPTQAPPQVEPVTAARSAGPVPLRDITPVPAPAPGSGARSLVLLGGMAALGVVAGLWVLMRLARRRRR